MERERDGIGATPHARVWTRRRVLTAGAFGAVAVAAPAGAWTYRRSTATAAVVPGDPSTPVRPIDWRALDRGAPTDPDSARLALLLRNATRWAAGTWWADVTGFADQPVDYLDLGGIDEEHVRPAAAQAFALATALALDVYAPDGDDEPSAAQASRTAVRLAGSLAHAHRASTGEGWGDGWQTAHWAAFAGFAGWLLWEDLAQRDRIAVSLMVQREANRLMDSGAIAYRSTDGSIRSPGDTKGEEDAWNSHLLQVATAMMPTHPNWSRWMNKCVELMLSATSRPEDLEDTTVLHGHPVHWWIDGSIEGSEGGTNVNSDGTVVNHEIVHPDYMELFVLTSHAALTSSLAGVATPKAAFHNADVVYRALVDLEFTPGQNPYADDEKVTTTVREPGGTIYIPGRAEVFYPFGNDFGEGRRMQFVGMDAFADAFGLDRRPTRPGDPLASRPGAYWLALHSAAAADMQERWTDGHTYDTARTGAASEDSYAGREEWVSHHAAWAYLARWISHQGVVRTSDQAY